MSAADVEQAREFCRAIKAAFGPGVEITVTQPKPQRDGDR